MYTEDKQVKEISLKAFPAYNGKKFRIENHVPKTYHQYWDGGSKTDYVLLNLENMETIHLPNNSMFDKAANMFDIPVLGQNVVIITHSIFCGKDTGLTLYCRPDQINASMLPASQENFTNDEKIVLLSFGVKSSYAGIKNYRLHHAKEETGINEADYETAKQSLVSKGFINGQNALTMEGRNKKDLLNVRLYDLKKEGFDRFAWMK